MNSSAPQEIDFQETDFQETTPQPVVAGVAPNPENKSNLYKNIAWAVILLGFGIFMLLDPHMMDGATAEGRNTLFKSILIMIWSIPGGIGFIVVGAFLGYRAFTSIKSANHVSSTATPSVATPSVAAPAIPKSASPKFAFSKAAFSTKGNKGFSDKVAPSRRELEDRATKRKAQREKTTPETV
jgi:hypothetical protein